MTHTDPTAAALLRGVLLRPADDTARLVYADWLDEHAGTVPCVKCEGTRIQRVVGGYGDCSDCRETGTVSDGCAERAEFIRVQIEWERTPAADRASELVHHWNRICNKPRRAEWFGIKCPACDGKKKVPAPWAAGHGGQAPVRCSHCDGTGFAPTDVRRGFVERVACRMGDCRSTGDVLRHSHDTPSGTVYHLTDWARGVLKAHPVTWWEIVDREPYHNGRGHSFFDESRPDPSLAVAHGANIQTLVFKELLIDHNRANNRWAHYETHKLARDALALAVGRVARRLAGLPDSGTNAG